MHEKKRIQGLKPVIQTPEGTDYKWLHDALKEQMRDTYSLHSQF